MSSTTDGMGAPSSLEYGACQKSEMGVPRLVGALADRSSTAKGEPNPPTVYSFKVAGFLVLDSLTLPAAVAAIAAIAIVAVVVAVAAVVAPVAPTHPTIH